MSRRPRPRNNFCEPDIRSVPVKIYALTEPDGITIRYVGRSEKPEARLTYHCSQCTSLRMFHWTRTLRRAGQRPRVIVLRTVPPGECAAAAELAEIRRCEAEGWPLLNYFGLLRPPKKLYSRHPSEFVRECAELGHQFSRYCVARWGTRAA